VTKETSKMEPSIWQQLIDEIQAFPADLRDLPVWTKASPREIRARLESRYTFDAPVPLETVVADAMKLLREWTVHVTHPRYFGLFNPSVRQASILADSLVALYNPQLAVWSHAAAANEIERHTLRHFAAALGMDRDTAHANFTSGGAEANLSAVLVALAHHFPEAGETGLSGLPARPAIYATGETHHSFVKIARMSGLGTNSLRLVPLTEKFTMDTAALEDRISSDLDQGWHPLLIVGTAGTTSTGAIDPLPQMAEIAADCGAWFHVDGAWGAAAVLSPRLRPELAGIERADSITWDAHKWLSVPMGAGMFFCRHPESVRRAFAVSASYMPGKTGGDTSDPYAVTAQWSRRAIGLKVFMALAEIGLDGYSDLIDHQTRMGDLLRERLGQAGWEIVNHTRLPVVCFTHPDIRAGRCRTRDVLKTIYQRGRVWISDVVLEGQQRVLRACITSFQSNEADIECLLEELEHARDLKQSGQIEPGE
jgi:aromatic-L-amino-acid/L-tryptophan decarboxylase